MQPEPGSRRGRAVTAAKRAASAYRANRDDLEPLVRLVADVLALAAIVRRRRAGPAETTTKEASG